MTQTVRKFLSLLLLVAVLLYGCNEQNIPIPTPTPIRIYSTLGILHGNLQRTSVYPKGGSPQLGDVLWEYDAGKSATVSAPILANGRLYTLVGNNGSTATEADLHELDAQTGKLISVRDAEFGSMPTIIDNTIYYGDEHGFYAIDTSTGVDKRRFETSPEVSGYSPLVVDGSVYLGNQNTSFYAIDAATGKPKWKFSSGSGFHSLPAASNGEIFVNGAIEPILTGPDAWPQNNLFALDEQTGQQLWKFESTALGQKALADPLVMDGIVYCASYSAFHEQPSVYALDAKSGKEMWSYQPVGASASAGIDLAGESGRLYAATSNTRNDPGSYSDEGNGGVLYALDSKAGSVLWTFKSDRNLRNPAIASDTIYVVGYDGEHSIIYGIDTQTGHVLRQFQYGGPITSALAIDNGVVYFTSNYETLVAVK
jgi:outer membrane protein assembly factor BamB